MDLKSDESHIQTGLRPAVILQNNAGNHHSSTTIIAPMTTSKCKKKLPTHVDIEHGCGGLDRDCTVLAEQVRTVSKSSIYRVIGSLNETHMEKINNCVRSSLAL